MAVLLGFVRYSPLSEHRVQGELENSQVRRSFADLRALKFLQNVANSISWLFGACSYRVNKLDDVRSHFAVLDPAAVLHYLD